MIKERNKTIKKTNDITHNYAQLEEHKLEKKRNTVIYDRLYIICNDFPVVELSSSRTFRHGC